MRNAETILGIIRNRGTRGLPVNDLYRQLWNPNLYLMAYGRIAKNDRRAHPRSNTGDRRRDEDGRHPRDHRGPSLRALPMDSGPPRIHPESQREAATTRTPHMVGQGSARSDASPTGGVLRTAVQRPITRLPAQTWMPHGVHGDYPAPGRARHGSSKETSPVASTTSTIRCCWKHLARTSKTIASCGSFPISSGLATLRTGSSTPPTVARRRGVW